MSVYKPKFTLKPFINTKRGLCKIAKKKCINKQPIKYSAYAEWPLDGFKYLDTTNVGFRMK